ncbi:hypothetical protein ABPG74_003092 [Tetrahymena malaccensis]
MKKYLIIFIACCVAVNCQTFNYNEEVAKDLAGFAILAYCNFNGVFQNNCGSPCLRSPQGFVDYYFLKSQQMDIQGIIGYAPDHNAIILTFRGTMIQYFGNIIRDLQFDKVPFPNCSISNCQVHKGFFQSFNDLKDQARYQLNIYKNKYPNSKVYITGHSLGAAIATIAVPYVYQWIGNRQIDAVYTFESPRVGNKAFSDWFTQQNFAILYGRITHHNDPVVQNPTSWWPLYFYHTYQEVYYSDFSKPYNLCYNPEDTKCGAQQNYFALDINDHMNLFGWSLSQAGSLCQI